MRILGMICALIVLFSFHAIAEEKKDTFSGKISLEKKIFDYVSLVANSEFSNTKKSASLGVGYHFQNLDVNLEIGGEEDDHLMVPVILGELIQEFSFEENKGIISDIEIFIDSEIAQKKEFFTEKAGILLGLQGMHNTKVGLLQTYFYGQPYIGIGPMVEFTLWKNKIIIGDSFSPSGQNFIAKTQIQF